MIAINAKLEIMYSIPILSDVNECTQNTDGCQQRCVNTPGSIMCECNSGYSLNGDGRTCSGESEALIVIIVVHK